MCVKFKLSVSESSRDIKGIVLSAGSVRLQTRQWQFDPDSASQRQFPFLLPTAAYIFFDSAHGLYAGFPLDFPKQWFLPVVHS